MVLRKAGVAFIIAGLSWGRSRRARRAGLLASGVILAFLAASAKLFVRPATNLPQPADAIVVLGGRPAGRLVRGIALARSGYAPVLVISQSALGGARSCAVSIRGVSVICFSPDPPTTQGEARFVAALANRRHWRRLIVIPSTTQTTRARIRFGRCYSGSVLMVPVGFSTPWRWAYEIVYEWGALAKALVIQRTC